MSAEGGKLHTLDEAEEAAIESGAEEVTLEHNDGSTAFQVKKRYQLCLESTENTITSNPGMVLAKREIGYKAQRA